MINVVQKQTCNFGIMLYDNECILKVTSQNCKCCVGFEKHVEYNADVEYKSYRTKQIMDKHVYCII